MAKQKCPHPDCSGKTKKYSRLKAHTAYAHEGKRIGGTKASGSKSHGVLRGELGRLEDLFETDPGRATMLRNDYIKGRPNMHGQIDKAYSIKGPMRLVWQSLRKGSQ